MTPYFNQDGIVLYNTDCRTLLPSLGIGIDCTITDPPWPGVRADIDVSQGEDPWELWGKTAPLIAKISKRLTVWLGVRSDPRFLSAVPKEMPYLRSLRLRYPVPARLGHVTNDGDRAYCFGIGWGHVRAGLFPGHRPRKVECSGRSVIVSPAETIKSLHIVGVWVKLVVVTV